MSPTRFRIALTLLGFALMGVIIAMVVLAPTGRPAVVPDAIEDFSPNHGDTVQRQVHVSVDMKNGYEITLIVDGVEIPASQLQFTEATSITIWRPTDDNGAISWPAGIHSISVTYDRIVGTADTGEFAWTFTVQ